MPSYLSMLMNNVLTRVDGEMSVKEGMMVIVILAKHANALTRCYLLLLLNEVRMLAAPIARCYFTESTRKESIYISGLRRPS